MFMNMYVIRMNMYVIHQKKRYKNARNHGNSTKITSELREKQ